MRDYIRAIKTFVQRGNRGWADSDIWDFDSYLSDIIIAGVRDLKKGIGCPGGLWDKEAKNKECWKWHEILEEIAQGFEAAKEMNHPRYSWEKKDTALQRKIDLEQQKVLTKKFERGMELFGKYFFNLWD